MTFITPINSDYFNDTGVKSRGNYKSFISRMDMNRTTCRLEKYKNVVFKSDSVEIKKKLIQELVRKKKLPCMNFLHEFLESHLVLVYSLIRRE